MVWVGSWAGSSVGSWVGPVLVPGCGAVGAWVGAGGISSGGACAPSAAWPSVWASPSLPTDLCLDHLPSACQHLPARLADPRPRCQMDHLRTALQGRLCLCLRILLLPCLQVRVPSFLLQFVWF